MPKVKFKKDCTVLDRRYVKGAEADFSDDLVAEVLKSGVGSIIGSVSPSADVRTAVAPEPAETRKAVKLGG